MPTDSTVGDLNDLYRQARVARAKLEPSWYLSLAYYGNDQWLAWDGRQLFQPRMRKNRITIVDNRIQPVVRKELARMTKNRPVFTVTPNSPDQEDANAAELGEQVMRFLWKHLKLHKMRMKALQWSRICTAGFLKCYWDSTLGEKVDVLLGPDGKLLTDANGAAVKPDSPEHMLAASINPDAISRKTVAQGDIKVEARSPFQMFVDPLCDSFDEAEWLIEESIKSPEYVKRRYGVEVQADTPANPGLIEARMGFAYVPGGSAYKGVKVREYWCKPNSTHPNGRRAVWVLTGGDKKPKSAMLEEDDRPFDPMPYVMFSGIPMPGRLWPMSIVDALRGVQTDRNKILSQMAENRNRIGNPSILASKQAVQDPEKFIASTTQPGGVIFFDDVGSPNAKPAFLDAPEIPEYIVKMLELNDQSIQEISGQHEVTSAQVPPGVTAASAINLLQEADDTMIGPDIADHEEELSKLGAKLLTLVERYYTDARTIAIGGDNAEWQIFDFKGSMLRGNTRVEVQAGSAFPSSKAAKQAQMSETLTFLAQSGNAPHGRQLAQFLEDNNLGAYSKLIEDYTVTETQCNRENVVMARGQALPINDYDDDQGHVDNHQDFQRGSRYQQLPPEIQRIFGLHVAAHRERLAQAQQQAMQLQAQAEGKPTPDQQAQQAQMDAVQQQQQMQGQAQQQQLQAAGQQQQMQLKGAAQAQQQGFDQASSQQQQRQSEQLHAQKLAHAEELHQHKMRVAEEQARQQVELARQRAAQAQQQRGGQNARK